LYLYIEIKGGKMIQSILALVGVALVAHIAPTVGAHMSNESGRLTTMGRWVFAGGVCLIAQKFLF
jgi:hypothetical protein